MSGPRVDFYVGAERSITPYRRTSFATTSTILVVASMAIFLKGKTQTLTLEDDVVEELEALLEYMFSGESVSPDALNISQSCQTGLQRCMSFIEYADKHGMSGASATVHDALQDILPRTFKYSSGAVIGPVHIETIFNHTPPHSPLRPLNAKAALSTAGITGNTIRKREREREGLLGASEALTQIRLLLKEIQSFRLHRSFQ
jgi:hypothetical protein